jgi:hypothetical protein
MGRVIRSDADFHVASCTQLSSERECSRAADLAPASARAVTSSQRCPTQVVPTLLLLVPSRQVVFFQVNPVGAGVCRSALQVGPVRLPSVRLARLRLKPCSLHPAKIAEGVSVTS